MTSPRNDLSGRSFGLLTVISQAEDYINPQGKHRTCWLCKCQCGKQVDVEGTNLLRGNTRSCGCTRKDSNTKHGWRHTRLYEIWTNMKTRCYDSSSDSYKRYGLRGIEICDEWRSDFVRFRDWAINNGYQDDLSIDRIDNDGNYCPENCRWVGAKEQANNRSSSRYVAINGIKKSLAEWADDLGYSRSIFHARAKLYHTSVEEQVIELALRNTSNS